MKKIRKRIERHPRRLRSGKITYVKTHHRHYYTNPNPIRRKPARAKSSTSSLTKIEREQAMKAISQLESEYTYEDETTGLTVPILFDDSLNFFSNHL